MNDPEGKFETAAEYVAYGRLPISVLETRIGGETFFIAVAPLDPPPLAMQSDSAAYAFDESGRLIDWSWDIGDDWGFVEYWWSGRSRYSSVDVLEQLGK